jgi:hypothetical protein
MAINVTTSKQQITASVAEDKISATVSGGFGATGPSGVINVTAPITNAGTTTAANVGLAVGTGLSVSGGSLVVTPDTYATLVGGKVPADQLPSYVDDVLEYANLASLPGTGESGKIYVALNTGKIYRWSGSAYFEISTQPGNTDAVPEGSTNLYFTNARARNSFGTGASGQVVRWDGSEWTAGTVPIASGSVVGGVRIGSGISIDGSGIISASSAYTLPTATASVLGGVKIGTGVTITDGAISVSTDYAASSDFDQGVKTTDDVEFNTARLTNGDTQDYFFNKTQLQFAYYDGGGYRHWVATTHSAGGAGGNRILFYTSDGVSAGTFPANAVLGLTVEAGGIIVESGGVTFSDNTAQTTAWLGSVDWNDVNNKPTFFDGAYSSLTGLPTLGTAASANTGDFAAASHSHGNITDAGAIGSTSGLVVTTGASGVLDALAQGTAGQVLKVNSGATGVEWGAAAADVTIDTTAADVLSATSGAISADDPGADRLVFWDDSAGKLTHLTAGTGLSISGTTITASVSASDISAGTLAYARMAEPTVTSPSQITANQNDYASFARGINRFTTNAARDITGMAAGSDGEVRVLTNVGTTAANTLTIKDESSSSTAANRFSVPWNGDCIIPAEGSVVVFYDGTSSRWRVI